jgi:signal transduction histidine kinase
MSSMSAPEAQPPVLPPPPRYPFSGARIDFMVSRAIVGFGVVFGVLVIPDLIAQQSELAQPFAGLQASALCAFLVWAVATALIGAGLRVATTAFAALYLVVIALWPLTVGDAEVDGTPWLWMLCAIACAYAAVGMRLWAAAVYIVIASSVFGTVMLMVGDRGHQHEAVLDALYSAIVGGVILTISTMLRDAAARVDTAQRSALDSYERGLRAHMGEAERVEVDALVHDSVLTTLLAAANARTPEAKALAARMAQDALGHLSSTRPAPEPSAAEAETDAATLLAGIRSAAADVPHAPAFETVGAPDAALPAGVAEALRDATVQAMVNSSQHAGGADVARVVTLRRIEPAHADAAPGVELTIADDGAGFDVAAVDPLRLGIANSIVQRVEIVGGSARVESAPGAGTTITLRWPASGASA